MGREGIKKCHFESDLLLYFLNEPSEALLISLMLIMDILNTVDVRLGSKYASGHVSFAAEYWKHQYLYIYQSLYFHKHLNQCQIIWFLISMYGL